MLVVVVVLVLLALWFFRDTLLLAFAAVIIAVGISIPAAWLQRLGLPRGVGNTLSALFIGVVVLLLLLWLLPAVVGGLGKLLVGLPQVLENASTAYNDLRAQNDTLARLFPAAPENQPDNLSETEIRNLLNEVVNRGLPILVSGGSVAVSLVTNLVFVVVIALLLLVDPLAYAQASMYLTPKSYNPRLLALWGELYRTLKTWLSALFISITITVSLVWIVLGLLGMPNVLVVAVFAGFATFVPNIGAFLPLIPIAIFTLAAEPAQIFVMVPAYLAIQLLESNVLSPLIVKRELNIPAAGMFVFQIVAGLVFGVLGVLLAVPLLAVIITLVREVYSYDVLGLRGERIKVDITRSGALRLRETETSAAPAKAKPRLPPEPDKSSDQAP